MSEQQQQPMVIYKQGGQAKDFVIILFLLVSLGVAGYKYKEYENNMARRQNPEDALVLPEQIEITLNQPYTLRFSTAGENVEALSLDTELQAIPKDDRSITLLGTKETTSDGFYRLIANTAVNGRVTPHVLVRVKVKTPAPEKKEEKANAS
jgi:hypothetical protein